MATRNDTIVTDYANGIAVTNGVTWNGAFLSLNAAQSVAFQMLTTNGAAGTFYINPTNVADIPGSPWYSGGVPNSQYGSNGTLAANSSGSAVVIAATGQGLAFAKVWLSFVPTASGNLYVAACVRRYPVS